jgi:chromatin assembly factor 1 subunit B
VGAIGRRESERSESDRDEVSGSKKRELHSVPEVEEARDSKKRRIAPTPVNMGAETESAVISTEEETPTAQSLDQPQA